MTAPAVNRWSRKPGSALLHKVARLVFGRYVETACGLSYLPAPIGIGMLCPRCVESDGQKGEKEVCGQPIRAREEVVADPDPVVHGPKCKDCLKRAGKREERE